MKELQKPEWLKAKLPSGGKYHQIKSLVGSLGLSTVCEEARCPNIGECWSGGTATLMLMGAVCTRGCRFCHVKTGNPKGFLDEREPEKAARAIAALNLSYAVLTSVDRDDLPDEGAGHFAKVVSFIKKRSPSLLVEVLTPDFKGRADCVETVLQAGPDVFAHNLETVRRLSPSVRDPRAGYSQSLRVLSMIKEKNPSVYTKSSLMLGLGEKDEEVFDSLGDLRRAGCDILTFGQYLRPSRRHLPVQNYVSPDKFKEWKRAAEDMGFLYAASGPFVRSSYRAGEFFIESLIRRKKHAVSLSGSGGSDRPIKTASVGPPRFGPLRGAPPKVGPLRGAPPKVGPPGFCKPAQALSAKESGSTEEGIGGRAL